MVLAAVVMLWTPQAAAQDRSVGGHVGFALPVVSRSQGDTTSEFAISVPIGIVFRKNTGLPIDVAAVPTLNPHSKIDVAMSVNTAHGLGRGLSATIGAIVNLRDPVWGFAPGLDKVLAKLGSGRVLVGDLFVPVLFHRETDGTWYTSVGLGVHVGVAF